MSFLRCRGWLVLGCVVCLCATASAHDTPSDRDTNRAPDYDLPLVSASLRFGRSARSYRLKTPDETQRYDPKGSYPQWGLVLTSFPWRSASTALRGLGLEGSYRRGTIVTQAAAQTAFGQSIVQSWSSSVSHYHLDALYQGRLWQGDYGPTVGARVGYGGSHFEGPGGTAPAAALDVLRQGLRLSAEFKQPLLAQFAQFELVVTYLGAAARVGSSERERGGTVSGIEGLSARFGIGGTTSGYARGITWGLWGTVSSVKAAFANKGDALEQYLIGNLAIGYAI